MDPSCPTCRRRKREIASIAEGISPAELPRLGYADRDQLPEVPAIYFALRGDEIVYIGQTDNVRRRWRKHTEVVSRTKPDDLSIAWSEFRGPLGIRIRVEYRLIAKYSPTAQGRGRTVAAAASGTVLRTDDLPKPEGFPPLTAELIENNRRRLLEVARGVLPLEKFGPLVLHRAGVRIEDGKPVFMEIEEALTAPMPTGPSAYP